MKTWLGLLLTVLGLTLGLGSTLLDNAPLRHIQRTSFLGISITEVAEYSPVLVGVALVLMVVSFFLIFTNREDEIDY